MKNVLIKISVLDGELDETQFEAAKRSLVCELVGGQSTIKSTAVSAILAIFRQVNTEFTKYIFFYYLKYINFIILGIYVHRFGMQKEKM